MEKTRIDWADSTWNPVTGCQHGCPYCYARTLAHRFSDNTESGQLHVLNEPVLDETGRKTAYPYGFDPTFHKYRLDTYRNKAGRKIFVGSMCDLFGSWIPNEWIREILKECKKAPQHTYMFLTKNPERYKEFMLSYSENMWFGTTITSASDIEKLRLIPKGINRFVSIEPIQERFGMKNADMAAFLTDWLIIGPETGNRKDKPVPEPHWYTDFKDACKKNGTPLFMKSKCMDAWNAELIQEYPDKM